MIRSIAEPDNDMSTQGVHVVRNLPIDLLEDFISHEKRVWCDITTPTESEVNWLQEMLDLHPLIVEDLRRVDVRPAMLAYTNYIFLSLFQPILYRGNIEGREIHCIVNEACYVTVRHEGTDTSAVDKAYDRAANNPNYWKHDVVYFLYLTIQAVIDAYYPLIDTISNRLNKLEQQLLTSDAPVDAQREVYRIKQQLITLRQMVSPQREVLSNVIGEERFTRTTENRELFRHLYERLMRVYDLIDSQRDLSSNVLDLIQSQTSAHLGEAVSRLTIFSMIFLPLTFIIGLFELNFVTTEPELRIPIPGITVLGVLLVIMSLIVGGMMWFFRRQKWL